MAYRSVGSHMRHVPQCFNPAAMFASYSSTVTPTRLAAVLMLPDAEPIVE